jgi:hypothetical protein
MRSIVTLGLAALAALVAGCQAVGYAGNPNFDDPFVNDTIGARPYNFPIVLNFPDDTMYFFPIYDGAPRSDLELLAIRCTQLPDGHVVVSATIENQGSSPIAPDWFRSGELDAIRVATFVTRVDGGRERVDATTMIPMTVAGKTTLSMTPFTYANDVARLDVIADPNRVVPDPLRVNNVLSWQGDLRAAPDCAVTR